jgi:2-polyprenyl-3-methyl-5-hydroxy-6-metoxy-1,4-benzoquinol methylase
METHSQNRNKKFWENLQPEKYEEAWKHSAKQMLSARELDLVTSTFPVKHQWILDIGIGTGRILKRLIRDSSDAASIRGIDISPNMVAYCREKYAGQTKIRELVVCDISSDHISFQEKFDYITAIRVLKYSQNWKETLEKLRCILAPEGILLFSMPNMYSISRWEPFHGRYHWQCTSPRELQNTLENIGYRNISICGFSRLPEAWYRTSKNITLSTMLLGAENILSFCLGRTFLTRELFVRCEK